MKLSQRARDNLGIAAMVLGVATFFGLVVWGLAEPKPAPAKPAAPMPVVVTQTLPVQAWTTVTVPTTVEVPSTTTVVETVTPAPVTETVTETATVTETVEAALEAPTEESYGTCDLPGGWYFVDGLEARTGMWARTAFDGSHVQVDPDLPAGMCELVILHETAHLLQAQKYGSVNAAPRYEQMADCWVLLQGYQGDLVYGCDESLIPAARALG